jgi:hypothetical protein
MINNLGIGQNNQQNIQFGCFKPIGNFSKAEAHSIIAPVEEFAQKDFIVGGHNYGQIHVVLNKPQNQTGTVMGKENFFHKYILTIFPFSDEKRSFLQFGIHTADLNHIKGLGNVLNKKITTIRNSYIKRLEKGGLTESEAMKTVLAEMNCETAGGKQLLFQSGGKLQVSKPIFVEA